MPSYVLGAGAGAGVGTYWDILRQDQVVPMSLEHHQHQHQQQSLDHVAMTTASPASSVQQRQQAAGLTCAERQLNCTTPRE